jgi:hypothetical protein
VDPRAGLEHMKEGKFLTLPEFKLYPLGHPANSHSKTTYTNTLASVIVRQLTNTPFILYVGHTRSSSKLTFVITIDSSC